MFFDRNILVDKDANLIKIADIGEVQLAKMYDTVGYKGGTPEYMAPERLQSNGQYGSTSSDLW